MNEITLKALKDSIAHWERMFLFTDKEEFKYERVGGSFCALCSIHRQCQNCPVKIRTKRSACRKTPYTNAHDAYSNVFWTPEKSPMRTKFIWNKWRVCALREINFLKSLLPKRKTKTI